MTKRPILLLLGGVLAAALGAARGEAQEAAPAAAPSGAPAWSGSASAYWYILPDDENFVSPVVTGERGRLHLEARFNYEDRDTGSFFGGWTFKTGSTVEFEATPMLGASVGQTDGIVPGLEFTLSWKWLSLYSENEYLYDLSDHRESFYFNWSEVTYEGIDWLSAGIITQRTRVYQSERDIQRGLLVRFTHGIWAVGGYWLNPGSDDQFGIVSMGLEF